jgi:addiction module HigA family antidote
MMDATKIHSFNSFVRMMYAYSTPEIARHDGWLKIGVPASQLNELLNAKRSLSAEMALLIGQALGLDPAPLLALQTDYNLLSAKRNKSLLERLKDIPRIAAVF